MDQQSCVRCYSQMPLSYLYCTVCGQKMTSNSGKRKDESKFALGLAKSMETYNKFAKKDTKRKTKVKKVVQQAPQNNFRDDDVYESRKKVELIELEFDLENAVQRFPDPVHLKIASYGTDPIENEELLHRRRNFHAENCPVEEVEMKLEKLGTIQHDHLNDDDCVSLNSSSVQNDTASVQSIDVKQSRGREFCEKEDLLLTTVQPVMSHLHDQRLQLEQMRAQDGEDILQFNRQLDEVAVAKEMADHDELNRKRSFEDEDSTIINSIVSEMDSFMEDHETLHNSRFEVMRQFEQMLWDEEERLRLEARKLAATVPPLSIDPNWSKLFRYQTYSNKATDRNMENSLVWKCISSMLDEYISRTAVEDQERIDLLQKMKEVSDLLEHRNALQLEKALLEQSLPEAPKNVSMELSAVPSKPMRDPGSVYCSNSVDEFSLLTGSKLLSRSAIFPGKSMASVSDADRLKQQSVGSLSAATRKSKSAARSDKVGSMKQRMKACDYLSEVEPITVQYQQYMERLRQYEGLQSANLERLDTTPRRFDVTEPSMPVDVFPVSASMGDLLPVPASALEEPSVLSETMQPPAAMEKAGDSWLWGPLFDAETAREQSPNRQMLMSETRKERSPARYPNPVEGDNSYQTLIQSSFLFDEDNRNAVQGDFNMFWGTSMSAADGSAQDDDVTVLIPEISEDGSTEIKKQVDLSKLSEQELVEFLLNKHTERPPTPDHEIAARYELRKAELESESEVLSMRYTIGVSGYRNPDLDVEEEVQQRIGTGDMQQLERELQALLLKEKPVLDNSTLDLLSLDKANKEVQVIEMTVKKGREMAEKEEIAMMEGRVNLLLAENNAARTDRAKLLDKSILQHGEHIALSLAEEEAKLNADGDAESRVQEELESIATVELMQLKLLEMRQLHESAELRRKAFLESMDHDFLVHDNDSFDNENSMILSQMEQRLALEDAAMAFSDDAKKYEEETSDAMHAATAYALDDLRLTWDEQELQSKEVENKEKRHERMSQEWEHVRHSHLDIMTAQSERNYLEIQRRHSMLDMAVQLSEMGPKEPLPPIIRRNKDIDRLLSVPTERELREEGAIAALTNNVYVCTAEDDNGNDTSAVSVKELVPQSEIINAKIHAQSLRRNAMEDTDQQALSHIQLQINDIEQQRNNLEMLRRKQMHQVERALQGMHGKEAMLELFKESGVMHKESTDREFSKRQTKVEAAALHDASTIPSQEVKLSELPEVEEESAVVRAEARIETEDIDFSAIGRIHAEIVATQQERETIELRRRMAIHDMEHAQPELFVYDPEYFHRNYKLKSIIRDDEPEAVEEAPVEEEAPVVLSARSDYSVDEDDVELEKLMRNLRDQEKNSLQMNAINVIRKFYIDSCKKMRKQLRVVDINFKVDPVVQDRKFEKHAIRKLKQTKCVLDMASQVDGRVSMEYRLFQEKCAFKRTSMAVQVSEALMKAAQIAEEYKQEYAEAKADFDLQQERQGVAFLSQTGKHITTNDEMDTIREEAERELQKHGLLVKNLQDQEAKLVLALREEEYVLMDVLKQWHAKHTEVLVKLSLAYKRLEGWYTAVVQNKNKRKQGK